MKRTSLVLIAIILSTLILSECKKDDSKITIEKLSGAVQKGPFISGSTIQISELNSNLSQTGTTFTTSAINSLGNFEITDMELSSPYLDVTASGFYFDEVNNLKSIAPLNLSALSNINDQTTININILTTLEKPRVMFLMEQNLSFSKAKQMAQTEVLAFFGIISSDMMLSETLDISHDGEANAVLLAVSLILQGNRSVGDLSELIYNISSEIREDGSFFNEEVMQSLRNSTSGLKLTEIRANLENYYKNLGATVTIPAFERYIVSFLKFTGETPTVTILPASEIGTFSVRLNAQVNPNTLSTQVVFAYGLKGSFTKTINAKEGSNSGSEQIKFTADVSGLSPGKIYNFKVTATNAKGDVISDIQEFTTLGEIPGISINAPESITKSGVVLSGQVDCKKLPTEVSFEYGLTSGYGSSVIATKNPPSSNEIVNVSATLNGLSNGTLYHYRLKAENEVGISYSNDMEFTTDLPPLRGTVQDIEGNTYKTIGIGTQIWTAENLRVKKYNDGADIAIVMDSAIWTKTTTPAFAQITDDPIYVNTYGGFYNWYAVNTGKLCPSGWHVPQKAEWNLLVEYAGGKDVAGGLLKSANYWQYSDPPSIDYFEFQALPSGSLTRSEWFVGTGYTGIWWSSENVNSTDAWSFSLWYNTNSAENSSDNNKGNGYSVRCVKDL